MEIRFSATARKDLDYWRKHDPKKVERIKTLCRDIVRKPYEGIGKPEPLKFDLQGYWSRRIDKTHRLIYRVDEEGMLIIACRHHY